MLLAVVLVSHALASLHMGMSGHAPLSALEQAVPLFSVALVKPAVFVPDVGTTNRFTVSMIETDAQLLPPGFNKTRVWVYSGQVKDADTGAPLGVVSSFPGPTFEVITGSPIIVRWVNEITGEQLFPVDPTLHWANPLNVPIPPYPGANNSWPVPFPPGYPDAQRLVPLVPHLHGGETPSDSDGHPDAWWTAGGLRGPAYSSREPSQGNDAVFHYPNLNLPMTLWYHDHTLGITRTNVYAGLAGMYLVRDPSDTTAQQLPSGKYEWPLLLHDHSFNDDGSSFFPNNSAFPAPVAPPTLPQPYWNGPAGNIFLVNGRAFPFLAVDRGQYLFRLVQASIFQEFNLTFYETGSSIPLPFQIIEQGQGYLKAPATVTSFDYLPGVRLSILFDFSNFTSGTTITMNSTGNVALFIPAIAMMQFRVGSALGFAPRTLPAPLNPLLQVFSSLPSANAPPRYLPLQFINNATYSSFLLNDLPWHAPVTETPLLGSTEECHIINNAGGWHPIHLHLVSFQIVARFTINATAWNNAWFALNGQPPYETNPQNADPEQYRTGPTEPAEPYERGFVGTVYATNAAVTSVRVRFSQQNGASFPFDTSVEPGYVWHCHILGHEDNAHEDSCLRGTVRRSLLLRSTVLRTVEVFEARRSLW